MDTSCSSNQKGEIEEEEGGGGGGYQDNYSGNSSLCDSEEKSGSEESYGERSLLIPVEIVREQEGGLDHPQGQSCGDPVLDVDQLVTERQSRVKEKGGGGARENL
jgi:hypothetical protein